MNADQYFYEKYPDTDNKLCGSTNGLNQKSTTCLAGSCQGVRFEAGDVMSVKDGVLVKDNAREAQDRHDRMVDEFTKGSNSKPTVSVKAPRRFETGATRDTDSGKLDFEGFLSPLVLERYAEYMHSHRTMADGSMRASDNWTKGIPLDVYMKSLWRHFFDLWKIHREVPTKDALEVVLCAVLFNVMGYLHETLKKKQTDAAGK